MIRIIEQMSLQIYVCTRYAQIKLKPIQLELEKAPQSLNLWL